ncbi:PREDICTED: demethylmenaquinone methyltransferase-like [Cyprinodon variegatus]|uniref:Zgc:194242 n=1 Tax=Cyprinodon variegatus TaxID=28743 RepID=A0A3Q2FXE4_CYPVA|nr:PREDICTED: demethylmenaquinone methyltransferase-like [Cyprinodon variegatus]
MWAKKLGGQLGRPTQSIGGWLVSKMFKTRNQVLEESAVHLCKIQPEETVLELGHGPGLGLELAAKLLTGPKGHMIGVDYSEYMHQMAKKQVKEFLESGKVTLHLCDVANMPLEDNSVDKVFHCNCYYFWPDLRKAATEIHRIMKPGGLIVTTLRQSHIAALAAKKVMPGENWRPEAYMAALRDTGFTDIRMEDTHHGNITFQAIYATASTPDSV